MSFAKALRFERPAQLSYAFTGTAGSRRLTYHEER